MAITRITTPPKVMRFAAYDLEWLTDDYTVRLVGVYDDRGYRPYRSVCAFLDGELTWKNRGLAFFGHWSGRFDIQQLAGELSARGYLVELFLSGSGAPIVRVARGRASWIFADSASILRTSLKAVGRFIGLPKLDCDTNNASYSDLCDYNRRDCEIVYHAIGRIQEDLLSIGAELKYTAASIALTVFRRKFLLADVDTVASINTRFRPYYVGARVERFRETFASDGRTTWHYRDVNSSFPWSYSRKVPGNLLDTGRKLPRRRDDRFLFLDCEVEIPETCNVPPIPYRSQGRIFFPTGRIRTILTEWDLDLCELVGARIGHIHTTWAYDLMRGMAEHAAFFFDRKSKATDPLTREMAKNNANFMYGKIGESGLKERLVINPPRTDCLHEGRIHFDPRAGVSSCMRKLIDPSGRSRVNAWAVLDEREIPHTHIPAVHAITSSSRGLIGAEFHRNYPLVAYGDTDSSLDGSDAPSSDRLGEFKIEHDGAPILEGHVAASKLYCLTYGADTHKATIDGVCKYCGEPMPHDGPCYEVRSKGFRRLTREQYRSLIEGGSVSAVRMGGLRENALHPSDNVITKSIRMSYECSACGSTYLEAGVCRCGADTVRTMASRPKRAPDGDLSRPWTVEELALPYRAREVSP